jgi:hydrogenase maturation protease
MAGKKMDAFLGGARRSPHEVGLLDLFDIARLTESLPVNRALIGIQPLSIEWGMSPTPVVAKSLPIAVEQAVALLERWGRAEALTGGNAYDPVGYSTRTGLISGRQD